MPVTIKPPTGYPPLRERLTEESTGMLTRPWARFVQVVNQYVSMMSDITHHGDQQFITNLGAVAGGNVSGVRGVAGAAGEPGFPGDPGGPGGEGVFDFGPILFKRHTYIAIDLAGAASSAVITIPPDVCIVLEVFAAAAGATLAGIKSDYFAVPPSAWRLVFLVNGGANSIVLNHLDPLAAEDERFSFPGSANYTLAAGQTLGLLWHPQTR